MQAEVEREKLQRLLAAGETYRGRLAAIETEKTATFDLPLTHQPQAGAYRRHLTATGDKLRGELSQLETQIQAQRMKVIESDRRTELLERLRKRRFAEWSAGFARELDELASDAHRARLHAARARVEKR